MADEFDGPLAATCGPRPPPAARGIERSILVLDVFCILGIVALGVVVALIGRLVEKL